MSEVTNKATYVKRKYDREYATQYYREMEYLKTKGFYPSFVRTDRGVNTWKYKRSPELFRAVADFYEQRRNEYTFQKADQELEHGEQMQLNDLVQMIPPSPAPDSPAHIFGVFNPYKEVKQPKECERA